MDQVDQAIRHQLLKPLHRRQSKLSDQISYMQALERLDERAIGAQLVCETRTALFPKGPKSGIGNWSDPEHVIKMISLAKALYIARRIPTDLYLMFVVDPVQKFHEQRWTNGVYDRELAPIEKAMRKVEQDHGLKNNEYWKLSEAPAEFIYLSDQYNSILDQKLLEALIEFGLEDIVKLKEQSPSEFKMSRERGRRSIFHSNEHLAALRDAVVRFQKDAIRAASAGAYSAAIISLGAGVEGLLLIRCMKSPHKAKRILKRIPKRLRPKHFDDPTRWQFETLIEVCFEAGWLSKVETEIAEFFPAGLAHLLRNMRNFVHPGRTVREAPWLAAGQREYEDAQVIYTVLLGVLGKVRTKK
ncbi:MAG: hypothetical protein WD075_05965 [Rhodospirillales bacterium]